MSDEDGRAERIGQLLETPDLADALESERFKQFLDHVPIAIAVAQLPPAETAQPAETIVYANLEFERLTGHPAAEVEGRSWNILPGFATADGERPLSAAVLDDTEHVGAFTITKADGAVHLDAWSNVIEDDDGNPTFRLVALAAVGQRLASDDGEFEQRIRDKDVLLRELQHRVKNNLQMITALIRLEARNLPDDETGERFDRLAGRIEALALLYRSLSDEEKGESIDLGVYLSEIAAAVMRAHAVEGIRLNTQVDTWPVSINVAMPTGLVVNELLTNALKHAFAGRDGGTITLRSVVDDSGCMVSIADDGVGLEDGMTWPRAGKLGALIVKSLRQNAKASIDVVSAPGQGMRVTIFFAREDAAPAVA